MTSEVIDRLKNELLCDSPLRMSFYHYVNGNANDLRQVDSSWLTGEADRIAFSGYRSEYCDEEDVERVATKMQSISYRKGVNIFSIIGLYLQNEGRFGQLLNASFENHSLKYKYLIVKAFPNDYEEHLKSHLSSLSNSREYFPMLLKHLYLGENIDITRHLAYFFNNADTFDISDLLLLEDIQNIQATGYNRLQEELFDDIRWAAGEIQRKHLNQNNSEDQYNSLFQSLLSAKEYECLDQTQSGESSGGKRPGELDILVRTLDHVPLGIFEAFKLDSIDSLSITWHLKKLSENYDPNGVRTNYAVVYATSANFTSLWERYQDFVVKIDYQYELSESGFRDVSAQYPEFADIKIGLSEHRRSGQRVKVYHVFMNMNY